MPAEERTERGRVALVTGGTGGIGAAVALSLATAGDRVIIVGRDRQRGTALLSQLNEASPLDHRLVVADLSLMEETARAADEVMAMSPRLDAAVFCAGILSTLLEWTAEDLERTLALNYLSRFLMIQRLLPVLTTSPSGRIVLVANAGKYRDTLDFSDLQLRLGRPGLHVSGRSQFANDLLAIDLTARLGPHGPAVNCVFPGYVRTAVFDNARGLPWAFNLLRPLLTARSITADAAAGTPAFLAHSPEGQALGGRFFGPHRKERKVPGRARRLDRREALWRASEDAVRRWL